VELAEYMAIPYVAVVYSVEKPDGEWVRRAEYPELPGCSAEAPDVLTAIDKLEAQRVRHLVNAFRRGEDIPVPRPPLKSGASGLSGEPVDWLLEEADQAATGAG
jgi:electron transfer flavoprotein alpha/beta subunit